MGEYEPEDSRVVTHSTKPDAAGLTPTGAKEDAVRDEAIRRKKDEAAKGEPLTEEEQPGVGYGDRSKEAGEA
ncbi:hypothetical protein GRI62_00490 [Erythrobacter arachoides]|uniref:Uncharacterized protein n=1 Tax=Aurantiacibacter arachoides TaxID=1850444 RepID=A0A844ZVL1_9SPHN|nr:hypothetical protein [Aurantiacibacter arachoides]MXO92083.1 hypothetical protein [Aurantiacibacter arachoides]GGD59897.1 hypothetical protein GCM10011411_20070 [Aurantiacibacter arachoides]